MKANPLTTINAEALIEASNLAAKIGRAAKPTEGAAKYHMDLSAALEACIGIRAQLATEGRSDEQNAQLTKAATALVVATADLDRMVARADRRVVMFHVFLRWQVALAGAAALVTKDEPLSYWELRRISTEYTVQMMRAQPGGKGRNICDLLAKSYESLSRAVRAARAGEAKQANGYLGESEKFVSPLIGKLFDADAEQLAGWHGEVTFEVAMISHPEA